jgi:hypothetical protein
MLAKVTTGQIYWGAVPFVIIQIVMVGLIIAFPGIVSRDVAKDAGNLEQLQMDVDRGEAAPAANQAAPSMEPAASGGDAAASGAEGGASEDPMKGLLESMGKDKDKKP